ncbi:hypothetical protein EHS25_003297 [Saitozyma podzolica]|uniref:Gfo/Idh/MocA-like oxidoreductase N-terminal domain-containing protein n=1 Tax=Saitozyma podzolica TaxID=1890683 RepID=A0A427Y8G1_9TREE|nr:hypothetical protein EHS25_003297 [Saitozyma podzolica]
MLQTRIARFAGSAVRQTKTDGRFNVLLLGAGNINFGTTEGPWNHSKRLEQKLGDRLRVVGVVDKNRARAEDRLTIKRADANVPTEAYTHTKVFESIEHASQSLDPSEVPHLAVDGFQSTTRGSTVPGHDTEMQLIRSFPDVAHLIEKPISAGSFEEAEKVKEALQGRVVSVGYMLRYLRAVKEMKTILDDNNLKVMATMATYLMAYGFAGEHSDGITKGYWDKTLEMGPVVGQGTHICDLTRFLAPAPLLDTISVQTVQHTDACGHLSKLKRDENEFVQPGNRIPRITNASWRYADGVWDSSSTAWCFTGDYDVELVVLADGWKLRLVDPYGVAPKLYVRRPVQTIFTDDDCYLSEISALVDVVDGKAPQSVILSTYADALESYKLTWAIRNAGEKAYEARGGPKQ